MELISFWEFLFKVSQSKCIEKKLDRKFNRLYLQLKFRSCPPFLFTLQIGFFTMFDSNHENVCPDGGGKRISLHKVNFLFWKSFDCYKKKLTTVRASNMCWSSNTDLGPSALNIVKSWTTFQQDSIGIDFSSFSSSNWVYYSCYLASSPLWLSFKVVQISHVSGLPAFNSPTVEVVLIYSIKGQVRSHDWRVLESPSEFFLFSSFLSQLTGVQSMELVCALLLWSVLKRSVFDSTSTPTTEEIFAKYRLTDSLRDNHPVSHHISEKKVLFYYGK